MLCAPKIQPFPGTKTAAELPALPFQPLPFFGAMLACGVGCNGGAGPSVFLGQEPAPTLLPARVQGFLFGKHTCTHSSTAWLVPISPVPQPLRCQS